jgi:hypothetical protein
MADPPMTADYTNYYQNESSRQLANDIATKEYNNAKAAGEAETRALERAKFAWQQTMDKAGLTGRFEDSWTMPTQQWFATNFGTWMPNGPQAGQQTQAAQQQAFTQAQNLAQMYGQYYAPGQTPTSGMQTHTAQEQAYTQWLRAAQQQLAEQKQQQETANQYLTLLSNLRGPADWAKYQQVLGATPQGMQDLVAAAAGQYVPGGGATTGMAPTPVSLQSLLGQATGQPWGGQPAQGGGAASFTPQGQMATGAQPGGGQTNPAYQAAGNGTNMMGNPQPQQYNLPAPNQVAPQAWKNLAPSQQELMKGQWESQGWYKPDVEALMNQALPKYAANAPSAGTWRLRQ